MFKIFKLLGIKDPVIIIKSVLGLSLILMFIAPLIYGYFHITSKLDQLDQANVLILKQTQDIKNLNEEILRLKQSNEITIEHVKELENKKAQVKQIVKKQIEVVTEKIEVIKNDPNLDDQTKLQLRSEQYIDSLAVTFCKLNPQECVK